MVAGRQPAAGLNSEKMMTIMVTGGAGFIGSHVVDRLMDMGHNVVVIDDLSQGSLTNIARHLDDRARFKFYEGDVKDLDAIVDAIGEGWRVKAIVHLAAMSRIQPSINDPIGAFHQNAVGTINVLEIARRIGVKRVVYAASSSAYGLAN